MDSTLAGTARVDLTPDHPVMLGGFGQRTEPATEVHDPIEAVALFIDADGERVLLLTTDLIATPAPIAAAVTVELGRRTGLEPHRIALAASHTHSAPVPFDPTGTAVGVAEFGAHLVDALVRAGVEAVAAARPARLRSAVGEVHLGFNRWRPEDPAAVDRRIPVLVVEDPERPTPLAVLFGAGCHPTTLGWDNARVSADYPGVAKRLVAERLDGAVALFVNTTEGDVVPVTSPVRDALDPRGYCGGSYADTLAVGTRLADEVVRVVRAAGPVGDHGSGGAGGAGGADRVGGAEPGGTVAVGRVDLELAANHGGIPDADAADRLAEATAVLAGHLGTDVVGHIPAGRLWAACSAVVVERDLDEAEMRRLMIACCLHLGLTARRHRPSTARPVVVPVQVLRLAGLELVLLPGEVLVDVGRDWARRAGSDSAFAVGLANAHHRYLPLRAHVDEPGAEARYEVVTAGLAPGGVEAALDAGARLLAALR